MMQCVICNRLRFAWYATATPCDSRNPSIIAKVIDADRKTAEYQEALDAYRKHRDKCPKCRIEME